MTIRKLHIFSDDKIEQQVAHIVHEVAPLQRALIVNADGSMSLYTNSLERVKVDTAGNVLLGGAATGYKLGVKGENGNQCKFDNAGQQWTQIELANNGTTKTYFWWDQVGSNTGIQSAGKLTLKSGGSDNPPVTMDTTGNLLVGASSLVNSATFSVLATGSTNGIGVRGAIDSNYLVTGLNAAGTEVFRIAGNGNVLNANNSYGAISDAKLKTNIEPARNYLDDLCAVQVRKYNFVTDPAAPKQLGVIAQELELVFPSIVEESLDRAERQKEIAGSLQYEQKATGIFDAAGNPVMVDDLTKPIMETYMTGEVTKSVKYSVFVPMLITAIQELKAKIDALEARLVVP